MTGTTTKPGLGLCVRVSSLLQKLVFLSLLSAWRFLSLGQNQEKGNEVLNTETFRQALLWAKYSPGEIYFSYLPSFFLFLFLLTFGDLLNLVNLCFLICIFGIIIVSQVVQW